MTEAAGPPVVVAGMGPVGMSAALALANAGVRTVVVEAGPDLDADPRASTFHPPTLEMLDRLGVAEELHCHGIVAPAFQYRTRDGEVAELDLGVLAGDTRYPYRLHSEQTNLTRIVYDRIRDAEHMTLRFGAPVTRVDQDAEGVDVHLGGDAGGEVLRASYVIAADGSNSTIRRQYRIGFEGSTYEERFLVISTPFDFSSAIPGLANVNYVSDPSEWMAILRTDRHWRTLFPAPDDETDDQALDPNAVQRRLQAVHALPDLYPIDHTNVYRVHQRVADRFRVGRIALVGDAAHINNPLGGMGMNSGIHDALAAVSALIEIREGADAERALAAYAEDRRNTALTYIQVVTHQNWEALRQRNRDASRERMDEWKRIAADPERSRAHLLRTSMIDSVRDLEPRLRLEPAA